MFYHSVFALHWNQIHFEVVFDFQPSTITFEVFAEFLLLSIHFLPLKILNGIKLISLEAFRSFRGEKWILSYRNSAKTSKVIWSHFVEVSVDSIQLYCIVKSIKRWKAWYVPLLGFIEDFFNIFRKRSEKSQVDWI